MTKFTTLNESLKTVKNKTVFNYQVDFYDGNLSIRKSMFQPDEFSNVLYLGFDDAYQDVFKAWEDDGDSFWIFFGEKGDEFND